MKNKMDKKGIFGILFVGAMLLFVLGTGVWDLCNAKDLHTLHIIEAAEILQVENSINGIIPTGTDHYYAGLDENGDVYIIHGPKNWIEKSFGADGTVTVTALAKKISGYEVEKELRGIVIDTGLHFPLGVDKCLELSYKLTAWLKIVSVLMLVGLIVFGMFFLKDFIAEKPIRGKIYIVLLLISLVLLLIAIL